MGRKGDFLHAPSFTKGSLAFKYPILALFSLLERKIMTFFLCGSNPFFAAYAESDLLGKVIILSLLLLSVLCWTIVLQKVWLTRRVQQDATSFRKLFLSHSAKPLDLTLAEPKDAPNPFAIIYEVLKSKTLEIFERKQKARTGEEKEKIHLMPADIALLETHASTTISTLTNFLERNLFILSTIVTLAPFLGLLGTVYGILTTFSELGASSGAGNAAGSNQAILGGLSLALSTTVLGLIDAIPALIGYNYLKHVIYDFDSQMQRFATDMLSVVELEYRKHDE